jgi:hypothetical protein
MKNPKFKIGDWVQVKAQSYLEYDNKGERQIRKVPVIKTGQICGARRRFLGTYVINEYRETYYSMSEPGEAHLDVKGSVLFWLVRTGYLNKPIHVLEEDIEHIVRVKYPEDGLYELFGQKKLPWLDNSWTKSAKEQMRWLMKNVPRDEKGRWL